MQEKNFLALKSFHLYRKNQIFTFILAIILALVATVTTDANVNTNHSPAFILNNVSEVTPIYPVVSDQSSSVSLQIPAPSTSIGKGQTARYSVSIDRSNFTDPVELGLTELNNNPTQGITFVYSQNFTTDNSVTLDITTREQTPLGTYNFVVTGKAAGITINDSNPLTLAVSSTQQDFSLSLSPNSLSVKPGDTANFTLDSTDKTLGNISLSVSGLPANATNGLPLKIKFPVTLPVITSTNTPPGTYTITVTGVSGNLTRTASATLTVQNVSVTKSVGLQVSQATTTIGQGQTASYFVAINRTNFTPSVELGLTVVGGETIPGLTFSYSQNPTTASGVTLNITTTKATPIKSYSFVVTGKAPGITIANSNILTLVVNSPSQQDFSLSLSPSSLTVRPGGVANFTLDRTNISGDSSGNISLSVSGLPLGTAVNFSNSSSFPLALPITTSGNTPLGTYTITIIGIRGTFTRTVSATLVVQNIVNTSGSVRIQVNQPTATINQGQIANYSVGINRSNFPSPVTLNLTMLSGVTIPGVTVTYSQNPTTATNIGLNIATTNSTPAGTYNFVLTGRASGITIPDSSTFTLVIKSTAAAQPDFNLSISPSSLTVKSGEIANFTLGRNDVNGFSSNVSVNVSGVPSNSINGLPTSFSFPVTLPIITSSDTPAGTYTITLTGIGGGLTRTASATLIVQNANIAKSVGLQVNQVTTTITQGQLTSYPVSINRTNFTDAVELGLRVLSGTTIPGLTFGYSQNPTTASGVGLNITTTNSIPVGIYNFVVTGKASGITIADSNAFTLVVNSNVQQDFSLSLLPSSLTINPGETANYTLNRTNIGGFSGNVVLNISGLPSNATSNVSSANSPATTIPIITSSNTPLGTYAITLTGISGSLTRTVSATLVVEAAKPMISSAGYTKPLLTINGANFGTDTKVFVNNKEVSSFIKNTSTSLISLKGNKKKLNLKAGSNQVKLISNGIESNSVVVSAFNAQAVVFVGEEVNTINPQDYYSNRVPKAFDSTDDDSIKANQPVSAQEEMYGVRED